MGCISSKADINDLHPNIFQVMNVDELGNRLSRGQLEITETDLVLYQRKKVPVKWPLKCLRRYGFDADLFSFESGRRCPTGPGIYAFRCQRAEQLFNMVQTNIHVRNNADDAVSREFPVATLPGPAVATRVNSTGDANYLEPSSIRSGIRVNAPNSIRFPTQNGGGPTRLGSVGSSNGPLSPQGTTSPSPPPSVIPTTVPPPPTTSNNNPAMYYANEELFASAVAAATTTTAAVTTPTTTDPSDSNIQQQRIFRQPYLNTETVPGTVAPPPPTETGSKNVCRLSVGSGDGIPIVSSEINTPSAQTHSTPSYINIDLSAGSGTGLMSPTYSLDDESNYARLELSNDAQQCHLYMNVIPGPENGASSTLDKPSATIRPKPVFPPFGKQQQETELEEPRHCYANLEPGEIEVARSHIPKRLSGVDRVPPLPLYPSAIQSQTNPMTPPPGIMRTVNYIVLDLDQSKSDSSAGNTNASLQPTSPIGCVPPSSLSLPPESPKRAADSYATIDFDKTVALSHSVNPNLDNDSEGSRKTRHNSTINDLVSPSTRLSSSE